MNTVKNFFGYFFERMPGQEFTYYMPILVLIGLLVLGAIGFSVIYNKKKKEDFAFKRLFRKTSSQMIVFAVLFLVLLGVRYENIPYFAMRLWLYVTGAFFLYFIYKNIKTYRVDYPRERQNTIHMTKKEGEEMPKYTAAKRRK